jgi:hypothetical protein
MRRLYFILGFLIAAASASAAAPALLEEALKKTLRDVDRWAYTDTTVQRDEKGRPKERTVVRFDPSKPYAEQYTPIEIDGKPPTPSALRKYRKKGEKRGARIEKAERDGEDDPKRKSLGELMDLENAVVTAEDAVSVTYEVPLKKEGNNRFPPEKFRVTALINKTDHSLKFVDMKLREAMRAMLLVKVKSGEATLAFESANPKFAPPLTKIRAAATASAFFVSIGGRYDSDRTDFKRVKPYGDRFDVQIGTMKALDF